MNTSLTWKNQVMFADNITVSATWVIIALLVIVVVLLLRRRGRV